MDPQQLLVNKGATRALVRRVATKFVGSCNLINESASNNTASFTAPLTACADTGSTHTLLRRSDSSMVHNIQSNNLSVQLPNEPNIQSHNMGTLYLSHLDHPINAHIFDDEDLSISLFSVSELCNAGCTATLTAQRISQRTGKQWHEAISLHMNHCGISNCLSLSPKP